MHRTCDTSIPSKRLFYWDRLDPGRNGHERLPGRKGLFQCRRRSRQSGMRRFGLHKRRLRAKSSGMHDHSTLAILAVLIAVGGSERPMHRPECFRARGRKILEPDTA